MIDEGQEQIVVEKVEEIESLVRSLGMIDYEHFLEFKSNCHLGMEMFGDPFIEALGIALSEASLVNSAKIINMWRSECAQYEMMYKMFLAKKSAIQDESNSAHRTKEDLDCTQL